MHGLNLGITATVSAKALLYGTIDHEQNKLIYISIVPYPNPLLTKEGRTRLKSAKLRARTPHQHYNNPGLKRK